MYLIYTFNSNFHIGRITLEKIILKSLDNCFDYYSGNIADWISNLFKIKVISCNYKIYIYFKRKN